MSELMLFPARQSIADGEVDALFDAIDLRGNYSLEKVTADNWFFAVTYRRDAPLGGPRKYDDDRWAIVFAGDLVAYKAVPFEQIVAALESENWAFLTEFEGFFAVAAYDKSNARLFAISDRRGQKPLFYRPSAGGPLVSSSLAVFARQSDSAEFNKEWLWESLYFNFPIDETTFLKGVKRLPPAALLIFDGVSDNMSISEYAPRFKPCYPLIGGDKAIQIAKDTFHRRVTAYYEGSEKVACALTCGWDGRTMLALAPAAKDVTAYTYGTPGCMDMLNASAVASEIGVEHITLPFEQSFVDELPRHILETVYLSGGLQGVLRGTLNHVYDKLTDNGRRFPLVISGIDVDGLFRGHTNVPNIVSQGLAELYQGGGVLRINDSWRAIIGADFEDFAAHADGRVNSLASLYGPFDQTAHHLSYGVYNVANRYFCGELALSDHYTTVRVPAWDSEVIDLAYSIQQSMLMFSQFRQGHRRGSRNELVLQSHLLKEFSPALYRIPVRGTHPAAVLAGELTYRLEKTFGAIRRRIRDRSLVRHSPSLEDWSVWLFDKNQTFINEILRSSETRITEFVETSCVEQTIVARDLYMLGKLLTSEIILRLIENRWRKFW